MIFWILTAIFATIAIAGSISAGWDAGREEANRYNAYGYTYAKKGQQPRKPKFDWGTFTGAMFMFVLFGGFIWALICLLLLGFIGGYTAKDEVYDRYDIRLAALQTGSQIEGRFFLGSGRIEEEPIFSYLYRQSDGGVKLAWVDADRATVYEDENDSPYLEIVQYSYGCNAFVTPFCPGADGPDEFATEYNFHIPKDSVISNYEITP